MNKAEIEQLLDQAQSAFGLQQQPGRLLLTYANSVEMVLGGVGKLVIETDRMIGIFPVGYNAEHDILIVKCLSRPETVLLS